VVGADLQFHPSMAEKYTPYTLCRQIGDWKAEWFYIDNHAPAFPERTPGPPKQCNEWYAHADNADQVGDLLKQNARRQREGVAGATVVSSWLSRQIQPLQCRIHPGFEYTGLYDPSRFSSEKTGRDEAMVLLYNIFEGVSTIPILSDLFRVNNSPNRVGFCVIKCFPGLPFCFCS